MGTYVRKLWEVEREREYMAIKRKILHDKRRE